MGAVNEGERVDQVSVLETVDHVCLNPQRMQQLRRLLGERGAHEMVMRAIEDLANRLERIRQIDDMARYGDLRKRCRALQAIADQIGLDTLIIVADDVLSCIDSGDPVALAATRARLQRIGRGSLNETRRMLEQSG